MDVTRAEEKPSSSDQTCPDCRCSMSAEWPDLNLIKQVPARFSFGHLKEAFSCPLCRMVEAIVRDAQEKRLVSEQWDHVCLIQVLRRQYRMLLVLKHVRHDNRIRDTEMVVYEAGEQFLLAAMAADQLAL